MVKDLPGFYYDAEKKKYFKIQANHAQPAGAKYSKETIQARKHSDKKRKREQTRERRQALQLLPRSRCLHDASIGGTTLHRELGLRDVNQRCESTRASFYAASLQKHDFLKVEPSHNVGHFVHDGTTGAVFAGLNFRGSGPRLSEWTETRAYAPYTSIYGRIARLYTSDGHQSIDFTPAQLTSMTLSPKRTLLTTCLGNSAMPNHAKARVRQLTDPTSDTNYLTEDSGTHFDLLRQTDVWCSASSPTGDAFAIGGSDGLELLRQQQTQWFSDPTRLLGHADIMAVEFQSHTTIMAGDRNGTIQFLDTRSGGKVSRLSHPSTTTAIRNFDEYRVIVCGLLSSLCMYDLRFAKPVPLTSSHRNASEPPAKTRPYLPFPQYNNVYRRDLGFDVDTELGLAATATEDHAVKLFSLRTGRIIDSAVSKAQIDGLVPCVCFARTKSLLGPDHGGIENEPKSLLVGRKNVIEEWHCYAQEDCSE